MTMTDCCCRTILLIAFLYVLEEAGLLVEGADFGTSISLENVSIDTHSVKLPGRHESSQESGAEPPTIWTNFALRRSMMTPLRVLDEVVERGNDIVPTGNDTVITGTTTTNPTQVTLSSSNDRSWCIAKSHATPDALQVALDWACGPIGGADCGPIQLGNPCFVPNTVYSHASYAFNSYYQIHQHASGTCDFDGVATVVYEDPSYPGCSYPYRSGQPGAVDSSNAKASRNPMSSFKALVVLSTLLLMWVM